MVAPHVILCYANTWKSVVKGGDNSVEDVVTFAKALTTLRDLLLCAVCRNLLDGHVLLSTKFCDHFVCGGCRNKERMPSQVCDHCIRWESFSEDKTLSGLLKGHSTYCRTFVRSSECTKLLESMQKSDPLLNAFSILDILLKGAKIRGNRKRRNRSGPKGKSKKRNEVSSPPKEGTTTKISSKRGGSIGSSNSVIPKVLNNSVKEKRLLKELLEKDEKNSIDIQIQPAYKRNSASCSKEQNVRVIVKDEGSSDDNMISNHAEMNGIEHSESSHQNFDFDVSVSLEEDTRPTVSILDNAMPNISFDSSCSSSSVFPISSTSTSISSTLNVVKPVQTQSPQPAPAQPQYHPVVLTRPQGSQDRPTLPPGVRLSPGTQTIRLARLSLQDGRSMAMVRQLVRGQGQGGTIRHISLPADLMRKIVAQQEGGGSPIIQYSGGQNLFHQQGFPQNLTVVLPQPQQQEVQQQVPVSTDTAFTQNTLDNGFSNSTDSNTSEYIISDQMAATSLTDANVTVPSMHLPEFIPTTNNNNRKSGGKVRTGCRCGNAATQPSKLTCCGQRCICYVDGKSCVDCKCRGCNNPYVPGGKILKGIGINTVIDAKTNSTVPILNSVASVGVGGSGTSSMHVGLGGGHSSTRHTATATVTRLPEDVEDVAIVAATTTNSTVTTSVSVVTSLPSLPSLPQPSHHPTLNLVNMIPSTSHAVVGGHQQMFTTRIAHQVPGPSHQTSTFSPIFSVAGIQGPFGQFTIPSSLQFSSLPISLISPANAHPLQPHHEAIHLQNIQLNPNLNLQNQ